MLTHPILVVSWLPMATCGPSTRSCCCSSKPLLAPPAERGPLVAGAEFQSPGHCGRLSGRGCGRLLPSSWLRLAWSWRRTANAVGVLSPSRVRIPEPPLSPVSPRCGSSYSVSTPDQVGTSAPVAQRIEHLTTDQGLGVRIPSVWPNRATFSLLRTGRKLPDRRTIGPTSLAEPDLDPGQGQGIGGGGRPAPRPTLDQLAMQSSCRAPVNVLRWSTRLRGRPRPPAAGC